MVAVFTQELIRVYYGQHAYLAGCCVMSKGDGSYIYWFWILLKILLARIAQTCIVLVIIYFNVLFLRSFFLLGAAGPEEYHFVNQGDCFELRQVEDDDEFEKTKNALSVRY